PGRDGGADILIEHVDVLDPWLHGSSLVDKADDALGWEGLFGHDGNISHHCWKPRKIAKINRGATILKHFVHVKLEEPTRSFQPELFLNCRVQGPEHPKDAAVELDARALPWVQCRQV